MIIRNPKACAVLNTRPAHQADALTQLLQHHNISVIEFPTIAVALNPHPEALQHHLSHLARFDKVILVSANAANAVKPYWSTYRGDVFCIGSSTAAATASFHAETITPNQFSAKGLLEHPKLQRLSTEKILILCGTNHNRLLSETLKKRGADVTLGFCYSASVPTTISPAAIRQVTTHTIDIIISTTFF